MPVGLLPAASAVGPRGSASSSAAISPGIAPESTPADDAAGTAATPSPILNWVAWSPNAPWDTGDGGLAANASGGTAVLFGGLTETGLTNLTFLYNESNNTWTPLDSVSAPSPRMGFGFAAVPGTDTDVLFGGETNVATGAVSNATYSFDVATRTWTNLTGPTAPLPRLDPAFAVGNGIALLYGGWVQNVSGVGEQTFSDTWELNLTTHSWTRILPSGVLPGALHGAGLVWQPSLGAFLLFGGCYPCTAAISAFAPANSTWWSIDPSGAQPAPRMNAVWVYDPGSGVDLLYGGTNGSGTLASTYLYHVATNTWTRPSTPLAPSARWGAQAQYFAVPGNQTVFLTGGINGSSVNRDAWRFSEVSNLTIVVRSSLDGLGVPNATVTVAGSYVAVTNDTGYAYFPGLPAAVTPIVVDQIGFLELRTSVWLPPGGNPFDELVLIALAPGQLEATCTTPSGSPVAGVVVSLVNGTASPPGAIETTNASGVAFFPTVPSANYTLLANESGYHPYEGLVWIRPGVLTNESIPFQPLFVLTVVSLARLPDGSVSVLVGAHVYISNRLAGSTNGTGVLAATLEVAGTIPIRVTEYGFYNASTTFNASSTGTGRVQLVLTPKPYPVFTIEVLGQLGRSVGFPVRNATVSIANVSAVPTGPYNATDVTGAEGTVAFNPPVGNYSVKVSAAGFLPNLTTPLLLGPPSGNLSISIYLSLIGFSTIQVTVLSGAVGNAPIASAHLFLNFSGTNLSDGLPYPSKNGYTASNGIVLFGGVPEGTTHWSANAIGYVPANGTFEVIYGGSDNRYTIYLFSIPPPTYLGLSLFPSGADAIGSLALVPAAGVFAALLYLTLLRNPSSREREVREEAESVRAGLERRPGSR